MIRVILLCPILFAVMALPAAAHRLKVFATVDGDAVAGYAFFIGGGRAIDTPWIAKDSGGSEIGSGKTDGEGKFRVVPPRPVVSDITITVDTREGHIASAVVAATRFTGGGGAPTPPAAAAGGPAPPPDPAAPLASITAESVETAVQRQIEPLLERIEVMDSRLRFTDALSGIFLIVGAAGIFLWARRRA